MPRDADPSTAYVLVERLATEFQSGGELHELIGQALAQVDKALAKPTVRPTEYISKLAGLIALSNAPNALEKRREFYEAVLAELNTRRSD
jgi:hypothetical protein